jgi:hypothetical protein
MIADRDHHDQLSGYIIGSSAAPDRQADPERAFSCIDFYLDT